MIEYSKINCGSQPIVAVSATGNVTRGTIERLSSNPNGNIVLSHRYPCMCDSAVCVQPFRCYH